MPPYLESEAEKPVPRKCVVRVVMSKEQKEILDILASRLGTSESETLRMALMDYAKELSLMKERIHRGNHNSKPDLSSDSE